MLQAGVSTGEARWNVKNQFIEFLKTPSCDTFMKVRAEVVTSPLYEPYTEDLDAIIGLVKQEDFEGAQKLLMAGMANLLLSPRAHLLSAMVADKLGDADRSRFEGFIARRCIDGIMSTGDGTADKPWVVTQVSDEYDVLNFLSKEMEEQALHDRGERRLDSVRTKDGGELWFDITDPFRRLKDGAS